MKWKATQFAPLLILMLVGSACGASQAVDSK